MGKRHLLLIGLPLFFLVACARLPLSEEVASRIDPTVTLADIKANPEKYQGTTVLLGGQIVDNQATQQGSVLEVLIYRLSGSGLPIEVDEAGGRILVRSERFLDPEVYEKSKYVTLAGTFAGVETRPLQGVDYRYPVFRLDEIYLWRQEPYYGYPGYYGPYGPYGYPYYYPYDPFWYGHPWGYRDPFYRHPWYW